MYIKKFIILLSPLRKHNRVGKELSGKCLTKANLFHILNLDTELESLAPFWFNKSGGTNTGLFFYRRFLLFCKAKQDSVFLPTLSSLRCPTGVWRSLNCSPCFINLFCFWIIRPLDCRVTSFLAVTITGKGIVMTTKGQKIKHSHREPRKGCGDLWIVHPALSAKDHFTALVMTIEGRGEKNGRNQSLNRECPAVPVLNE